MKIGGDKSEKAKILRQKAEDKLKAKMASSPAYRSDTDMLKLIHELEVHQIELEMQNDELLLAQKHAEDEKQIAEAATEKYTELYDFAPTGYFTLSKEGKIIELNLQGSRMLGDYRQSLIGYMFSIFISPDTKHIFSHFFSEIFNGDSKQSCEVTFSITGNMPINVLLSGILTQNGEYCLLTAIDITDRRKVEDLLASMSLHNQTLLQTACDGIHVLTDQGIVIEANHSFCNMLGYTHEEVLQLNVSDWDMQWSGQKLVTKIAELISHPAMFETVHRHKDGTFRNVEINAVGVILEGHKYLYAAARDITDRKKAEILLKESETRFKNMFERHSAIMLLIEPVSGSIIDANDSAARFYGYNKSKLCSMNIHEINTLPLEEVRLAREKAFNQERNYVIFPHKLASGEERTVEVHSSPINFQEKQILFSIIHDITERKLAEAEIKFKSEELQKANAEKDKFFSIIAHDLRSPFNGFLGLTDILATGLSDLNMAEIQKIAVAMKNSATNLFVLLENLLEWSRMQRGLILFVPVTFLIKPKILWNLVSIIDAANIKKIAICYDIPEDIMVSADENMFGGIIRNLVSNAVKFTRKEGKITITANVTPNNSVEISIIDTGIGMNKSMIDNLFRLDANISRHGTEGEPSTGLGLIICKDFIEKHGGRFWVESEVGIGSTFRFTLPGQTTASRV